MTQPMVRTFHPGFSLFVFAAMFTAACNKPPKGDQAIITDEVLAKEGYGDTFILDTVNSYVRFTDYGVGKNYPGTFNLTYGQVKASDDKVNAGTFIIDLTSLDLGQDAETDEKSKPHLVSGGVFDVNTFGTAQFEITKIEPYKPKDGERSLVKGANFNVSGNLEIKNVTKNITFPARIDLDGDRLEGEANFDIDRRQWQMNYGNTRTLDERFIAETVNVQLRVEALREGQALEL